MADKDFEQLIKGGLIGAILGAWLSKSKEDGAILGAIIGAAVFATKSANKQAVQTKQPFMVAENGKLYEIQPTGEKKFIKDLEEPTNDFPVHFRLP